MIFEVVGLLDLTLLIVFTFGDLFSGLLIEIYQFLFQLFLTIFILLLQIVHTVIISFIIFNLRTLVKFLQSLNLVLLMGMIVIQVDSHHNFSLILFPDIHQKQSGLNINIFNHQLIIWTLLFIFDCMRLCYINIYRRIMNSSLLSTKFIFLVLAVAVVMGNEGARCPNTAYKGSLFSEGQLVAAYKSGIIPLSEAEETHCYDYVLPYSYKLETMDIAVSVHEFDADHSEDLNFFIKPTRDESKNIQSVISFVIRVQWKYTKWNLISFSFFIEDHQDIESGYYQIDSGSLSGCRINQDIQIFMPYRNQFQSYKPITHTLFVHGFQIHTIRDKDSYSPYQMQISQSTANITGIIAHISVTSFTQLNSIYISFIAFQELSFEYKYGKYEYNPQIQDTVSYNPPQYIPKNFARIYGITGFIFLSDSQDIIYKTNWNGQRFLFTFGNSFSLVQYFSFEYIFFVGSQCQDCYGYPIWHDGKCLNHCPTGTYLTEKNTCIICEQGTQWNGTNCVKSCPAGQFLHIPSGKCQCPPTLNWNGQICIPCTNGKIFSNYSKQCHCPKPLRWNGFTCAQIPECIGGKIWDVYTYTCICPEHLFWDQNSNLCKQIPKCIGGQIMNMFYQCVCPQNYYWNNRICVYTHCFGGQVWDGSKCVCKAGYYFNDRMCVECINGQIWDYSQKICKCQPGFSWNGNFCEATYDCEGNMIWNSQYEICVCAQNFYWSGYTCLPLPDCDNGRVWNKDIHKCACPKLQHWNGHKCIDCSHGAVWDQEKLKCICPPGTIEKGDHCQIIQVCTGGKMWMEHLQSCECPSQTQWNGNYCISNPCQRGRVWSERDRSCICPKYKVWNGNKCVPPQISCNNGRIWDQNLYTCVCPDGTYSTGNACINVPICSGDGTIYNPFNKKCVCKHGYGIGPYCEDKKCHGKQIWNGYRCAPIVCHPPSYFSNGQCITKGQDSCNPGYYWNGFKCIIQPIYCPADTQWKDFNCKSKQCSEGYYTDKHGNCLPLSQKCLPPTFWDGTKCSVKHNKCPPGTYGSGRGCLPVQPCSEGFKWSEKFLRCECPSDSIQNEKRCIKCDGDMIYVPGKGCECPDGKFNSGNQCDDITTDRCLLIPHSYWPNDKCQCRPGFTKVGFQCICYGVKVGNYCDRCSQKPNSQFEDGLCKCKYGYTEINNKCVPDEYCHGNDHPNSCNVGSYFDPQKKMCLPCPVGCISCKDCYSCRVCRPGFTYCYDTQNCIEHCGDGKKFTVECDDGNNDNNDGCTKDCRVQPGYICRGGSPDSKDICTYYQPQVVTLTQSGQIRKSTSMILSIKADYIPKSLLLSKACESQCENILLVNIISGDTAISVSTKYIPGTSFSFISTIEFGRSYISQFYCKARINPAYKSYFGSIDISQQLSLDINPAYLALVADDDLLD